MQKKGSRLSRDPYYYWKVVNMVLACTVLILFLLILSDTRRGILVPVEFLLGTVMCGMSGVMELAKGKKLTGYISAVFAGVMAVALIFYVVWLWFL